MQRTATLLLVLAGAGLVAWSAALHLYLYGDYFHRVPTIGPLFVVQGAVGCLTALAIVAFRRSLMALAGAVFLIATAGGLLFSVWHSLFGYHERFGAPYVGESLIVEGVGAVLLIGAAGLLARN